MDQAREDALLFEDDVPPLSSKSNPIQSVTMSTPKSTSSGKGKSKVPVKVSLSRDQSGRFSTPQAQASSEPSKASSATSSSSKRSSKSSKEMSAILESVINISSKLDDVASKQASLERDNLELKAKLFGPGPSTAPDRVLASTHSVANSAHSVVSEPMSTSPPCLERQENASGETQAEVEEETLASDLLVSVVGRYGLDVIREEKPREFDWMEDDFDENSDLLEALNLSINNRISKPINGLSDNFFSGKVRFLLPPRKLSVQGKVLKASLNHRAVIQRFNGSSYLSNQLKALDKIESSTEKIAKDSALAESLLSTLSQFLKVPDTRPYQVRDNVDPIELKELLKQISKCNIRIAQQAAFLNCSTVVQKRDLVLKSIKVPTSQAKMLSSIPFTDDFGDAVQQSLSASAARAPPQPMFVSSTGSKSFQKNRLNQYKQRSNRGSNQQHRGASGSKSGGRGRGRGKAYPQ